MRSISFEAGPADAEAFADALLEAGAVSVDLAPTEPGDTPESLSWSGDEQPPWRRVRVSALFLPDADTRTAVESAARAAGVPAPGIVVEEAVEDRDWVRLTQAQFQPIRASRRLWIVPSWHEPPEGADLVIRLDPGLAFGTGSHPTTRLCLQWLDEVMHGGEHVLDFGCGSGILAIAALKLGAARATGIDIDPLATEAARANAALNGVSGEFLLGEAPGAAVADVVVANILANPLILLAPSLAQATRAGGRIALSGILRRQGDDVLQAYAPWFDISPWEFEDDWVCIAGVRRHD